MKPWVKKHNKKLGVGTIFGNVFADRVYRHPRNRKDVVRFRHPVRTTFVELITAFERDGARIPAPVPRA